MHHWKLKCDVTEVTRALVVLIPAGLTTDSRVDNTHLRVHQTLLVCVTVVLVGISSLHLDGRHLADLIWIHQAEFYRIDPLRDLGYSTGAHLWSSSSSRIATPRLFISSRSSLNA
uniref:Uncharacterized protein n=1 Tax=uncultured marine group II/III euryarchaeote KM3_72_A06 TaxID=1456496 RepID=A0A075HPV7_9EURY|nr:hypothetical protein [uncultured marine group II/III euryarchaeote KM3_72_A06]